MTKLWQALTDELGAAFKNQYGLANETSFHRWSKELAEFTEQQLFEGFQKFKKSDSTFLNLKTFRNYCRPSGEDLGLPPFDQIHLTLCQRDWEKLHPAFQHVARNYDMYNIRLMSSDNSAKALRKLYSEVVDRLARGEQFERLESLRFNPSGTTHTSAASREKGKEVMAKLLRGLV